MSCPAQLGMNQIPPVWLHRVRWRVGMSLPSWVIGPQASVQPAGLQPRLKEGDAVARAAHMRSFAEGTIAPNVAVWLTSIGVDNISSPRIWPACGEPDAMLKWPASRLAAWSCRETENKAPVLVRAGPSRRRFGDRAAIMGPGGASPMVMDAPHSRVSAPKWGCCHATMTR